MEVRNQLGAAVSSVLAATFDDSDYYIESECNGAIWRAQVRRYNEVAQRWGFRDLNELRDEVEKRTSYRWVFHHIPHGFEL